MIATIFLNKPFILAIVLKTSVLAYPFHAWKPEEKHASIADMRGKIDYPPPSPPPPPPPNPESAPRGRTRREILFWAKRAGELVPALALLGGGALYVSSEISKRQREELERRYAPGEPSSAFDLETAGFMRRYQNRRVPGVASPLEDALQNGGQETINGGGLSRIEYVRRHIGEHFRFPDDVPEEARAPFLEDLSRFAVGLAAQESRFDNNAESHMGATRIFQFMEDTHEDLGYSSADMTLLTNQVEAASKYLARAYAHIWRDAKPALIQIQERFFNNNPVAFQREFMLPVLINSYNAGPTRMIAAVNWFAGEHDRHADVERGLEADYNQTRGYGFDVFHLLTRSVRERGRRDRNYPALRRYGEEASEYVARVRAFMALIEATERAQ